MWASSGPTDMRCRAISARASSSFIVVIAVVAAAPVAAAAAARRDRRHASRWPPPPPPHPPLPPGSTPQARDWQARPQYHADLQPAQRRRDAEILPQ